MITLRIKSNPDNAILTINKVYISPLVLYQLLFNVLLINYIITKGRASITPSKTLLIMSNCSRLSSIIAIFILGLMFASINKSILY